MSEMSEAILNSKVAIGNKLLQGDGTITDIAGNPVFNAVDAYNAKQALPNKFLNPDGSYSTLNEILAGVVDTDLFEIVQELPEVGNEKKIYLVPNGKGTFDEYHYHNGKWDPIGTLDISGLVTTDDLVQALQDMKDYVDTEIAKIAIMTNMDEYPSIEREGTTKQLVDSIKALKLPIGTILLGDCALTDVVNFGKPQFPGGMTSEEIKVEVFNYAIMFTMTSVNVKPYEWTMSDFNQNWEPKVLQDWVEDKIDEKVTQVLGGEY